MSFVEGVGAMSASGPDSALVICMSGVLMLLSLLAGVPALATALRWLRRDRGLGKFLTRFIRKRVDHS